RSSSLTSESGRVRLADRCAPRSFFAGSGHHGLTIVHPQVLSFNLVEGDATFLDFFRTELHHCMTSEGVRNFFESSVCVLFETWTCLASKEGERKMESLAQLNASKLTWLDELDSILGDPSEIGSEEK